MPLENGDTFAGYTVRRLLGSGGMGDVYLVEHPRLPRLDALKVLREASAAGLYPPFIIVSCPGNGTSSRPNDSSSLSESCCATGSKASTSSR